MNITTVRATRIGSHAHRYLSAEPRTGLVVSEFRNGFAALLDEDSDAGFVSLQSPVAPLHPWAIEVPYHATIPAVGTAVFTETDGIQVDDNLRIDIGDADVCELSIEPWTREEVLRAQKRMPLIDEVLQSRPQMRSTSHFEPDIVKVLLHWHLDRNPRALLQLIGLGSGSTPAGDDTLVGTLAGWHALKSVSSLAESRLIKLKIVIDSARALERTTLPSGQMVAAALAGKFPEPLCELSRHLGIANTPLAEIRKLIDRLSKLGASSGFALLLGFMLTQTGSAPRS